MPDQPTNPAALNHHQAATAILNRKPDIGTADIRGYLHNAGYRDGGPLGPRPTEADLRMISALISTARITVDWPGSTTPTRVDHLDALVTQAYDHSSEIQDELGRVTADRDRLTTEVKSLTAGRDQYRRLEDRVRGLLVTPSGDRDGHDTITVAQLHAAINGAPIPATPPTRECSALCAIEDDRDHLTAELARVTAELEKTRDAAHRQFKIAQATREQHAAEWAHLRQLIDQYGDDGRIPVAALREHLRQGPGLIDDAPPSGECNSALCRDIEHDRDRLFNHVRALEELRDRLTATVAGADNERDRLAGERDRLAFYRPALAELTDASRRLLHAIGPLHPQSALTEKINNVRDAIRRAGEAHLKATDRWPAGLGSSPRAQDTQIRAVCRVMDWPDDSVTPADDESPLRSYWDLAKDIVEAVLDPTADVDVEQLLATAREGLAAADTDEERAEVVETLLADWYAHWPASAVTPPEYPISRWLVTTLTPPADATVRGLAGVEQAVRHLTDVVDRLTPPQPVELVELRAEQPARRTDAELAAIVANALQPYQTGLGGRPLALTADAAGRIAVEALADSRAFGVGAHCGRCGVALPRATGDPDPRCTTCWSANPDAVDDTQLGDGGPVTARGVATVNNTGHVSGCYRCQLGDPHEVHQTAAEEFGQVSDRDHARLDLPAVNGSCPGDPWCRAGHRCNHCRTASNDATHDDIPQDGADQ